MREKNLYIRGNQKEYRGVELREDYTEIILISGRLKKGHFKGCHSVWYVATGRCVNVDFRKCYRFPRLDTTEGDSSNEWGPWKSLQVQDLVCYLNLPKKSMLFDRLLSGGI